MGEYVYMRVEVCWVKIMTGWLVFAGWLVVCLVDWLTDWLTGLLVDWLVG